MNNLLLDADAAAHYSQRPVLGVASASHQLALALLLCLHHTHVQDGTDVGTGL